MVQVTEPVDERFKVNVEVKGVGVVLSVAVQVSVPPDVPPTEVPLYWIIATLPAAPGPVSGNVAAPPPEFCRDSPV